MSCLVAQQTCKKMKKKEQKQMYSVGEAEEEEEARRTLAGQIIVSRAPQPLDKSSVARCWARDLLGACRTDLSHDLTLPTALVLLVVRVLPVAGS